MTGRFLILYFSFLISNLAGGQGIPPIGQWREHLPYNNAINVMAAGNNIVCATPYSTFSYDEQQNEFERLSKINGLSEASISCMNYDSLTSQFIIAYQNSNVDFIDAGKVINVPDIKLSTISGDKSIYDIHCRDKRAYLSSGLGVIVLSQEKFEIAETFRIGNNGNSVQVNAFTSNDTFFYAATAEGLKRAAINEPNLTDYSNWDLLSGFNGLAAGFCQDVVRIQDAIVVQKNDSLFVSGDNNWNFFYYDGWSILNIDFSSNKILLSQQKNNQGRITVLGTNGVPEKIIDHALLSSPRQAIIVRSEYWIADQNNGLMKSDGILIERVFPNSPINIASGEMIFQDNALWVAAGSVNDAWNYTFNPNGLFRFSGDFWSGVNLYVYPQLDTLLDFITVAADLQTGSIYAGSYGGGLLEIKKDNTFTIYKQNSSLQPATGDPGSYRVSGLAVDADNNLWIANFGAPQNLLVKKADGNWNRFTIPFFHTENAVTQILIDDVNQKWIVSPKGNGLFCFNDGGSIDNTGDDQWRFFRQGAGNGNLPSEVVYCVAKDKFGFIWIGTERGIAVVQCPQEIFTGSGCEAILPVVQQDNFAGYLFQDEQVKTIAVDGANRKWVGTKNGVWLISPEGDEIIYRFDEENSPLLSNDVNRITVDPQSGEVFISTFKGICSFRGTAIEGKIKKEDVLVFPNPVPPGFNGTIAIRGLAENSWVKITELNGRLVYQTRSLGGQAVWDGKDYKGKKVSSGVYLVLASDELNQEHVVTKIFFTR